MIVKEGSGFPKTVSALRKIPGIGEYTAGAIASIAFDEVSAFVAYFFPYSQGALLNMFPDQVVPVVDGNVIRVITRLKAISGNPKDSKLIKQVW